MADAGPLQDEEARVGQELVDLLVVTDDVLRADVLAHLKTHDLVESAFDIAVVAHLHLGTVGHAVGLNAIAAERDLLLSQRDAVGFRTELAGGPRDEGAPAATDVEQSLTRLQAQLLTSAIDLLV